MKCDICGIQDAVVFIRQVTNNESRELHLCRECAEKKGLAAENGELRISLAGLVSDVMQNTTGVHQNVLCPVCGLSLADLKRQKRVGCSACYETFRTEIATVMDENDIPHSYTGSRPHVLAGFHSILTERENLKRELEKAISREDYEEAVNIRDKLHLLPGGTVDART